MARKKPASVTGFYYDPVEPYFKQVVDQMLVQKEQLESIIAYMDLPVVIDIGLVSFYNRYKYNITSIVELAVRYTADKIEDMPLDLIHEAVEEYNSIEKSVVNKDGANFRGEVQINFSDDHQQYIDKIAYWLRENRISIPYMLRNGRGSTKVICTLSIILCAKNLAAKYGEEYRSGDDVVIQM